MRSARVRWQSPNGDGSTVLAALEAAAAGADRGGGSFAWTNTAGLHLLFRSAPLTTLLERGRFDLTVGVDSITDPAALRLLGELGSRYAGLRARVFLNPAQGLFHPKAAWFAGPFGLRLVVGSGNLTAGGLLRNWETWTEVELAGEEAAEAERELLGQLRDQAVHLVAPDDARALERAEANRGDERQLRSVGRAPTTRPDPVLPEVAPAAVLIAEIPRSGDRGSQANFTLQVFVDFFGAQVAGDGEADEVPAPRTIELYAVDDDGAPGEQEVRPAVARRSRNYSFELAALRGRPYPADGPPVAVFVRVDDTTYLYCVLEPGQPSYDPVRELAAGSAGRAGQLSRRIVALGELAAVAPDLPLLRSEGPAV